MVKRLATSPHDPLGITDSACKNQLVVVSVQYGPFNPYIPIRSTTIGKSRVAIDPITMHTSWRSNSDIASVTRTNQYNQDLGLIHSTNGNHLESPNEGSSIDHQAIQIKSPPHHGLSTGKSSVRDLSGPVSPHSSVVAYQIWQHHSDDSVGLVHNTPVGQLQRGLGHQSNLSKAQYVCFTLNLLPEANLNNTLPRGLRLLIQSSKCKGLLTQTSALSRRFANLTIRRHQALRVPPPALIQGSKRVANERAKKRDFSAMKISKNEGWMRWKSREERSR
ncbi:hypothetical protein F511_29662 [Dorcoceras hygrometricum]|uniref:Uncharacterized protein n=1 Tax=Dorcoceras hygrometricum TaxID=472368 RepID=A0A2Z7AWG4_9LAMI|nr:hypothetical protein F511_29662 [Dorcoceras hygrometricum]